MKRQQIVVDNKTYEVLATIYDEETDKNYCVFTDLNQDKNKGLKLSCVEYYEEKGELIPVRIIDTIYLFQLMYYAYANDNCHYHMYTSLK